MSEIVQVEINEQTLGSVVWGKLLDYWHRAHGDIHRGHFMDMFMAYSEGVADANYIGHDRLIEYVREMG